MRERSATVFPYAIAGALPLAGLAVAALERRTYDAALVTAASLLGALIWTIALTS